jgi:hypothetical protein
VKALPLLATLAFLAPLAFASDKPIDRGTANAVQSLAFDLAEHPAAEAADLYKFLHQAIYGPGHAIPDPDAAARWLDSELEDLGPPLAAEPPCEVLGGSPILVRVNLRPFAAGGGNAGELLDAFVATAGEIHGQPGQMAEATKIVIRWLRSDGEKELADGLERIGGKLAPEGYPAIHHSEAYIEAYRPAYRVVTSQHAATHGWCESHVKR